MAVLQQQPIFTWEDAQAVPGWRRVGPRRAHKWLAELRESLSERQEEHMDLTDSEHYDWQGYLANHREGQAVVGAGVTTFGVRFLRGRDSNMHTNRCDFVVARCDGTAVCLHPSGKGETVPVFGSLEHWLPDAGRPDGDGEGDGNAAAPAAPRGPLSTRDPPGQPSGFHGFSQGDLLGRKQAFLFLEHKVHNWQACLLLNYYVPSSEFSISLG